MKWTIAAVLAVALLAGCASAGNEGVAPADERGVGEQLSGSDASPQVEGSAGGGTGDDDQGDLTSVPGMGQAGFSIGGAAYYEPTTIEERVDDAKVVARVQIAEIGEIRYNTSDGVAPAGSPSMDDAGWIISRPITMTVVTAYKSDIANIATLQTFKLASPPELEAYALRENYSYEVGQEGIVLINEFGAEAEAAPLIIYLRQLEDHAPVAYRPTFAGTVLDWFGFSGSMAEGSMFDLESFTIDDLEERIEDHLGP